MGKNKEKLVEAITNMETDFAQWYTDVVKKADLADYSSVGGFIIFRPLGYAIWELIQKQLDARFKETGHENVYMPMMMPESLLQKESTHVKGFAPEVAWITEGGSEKLQERLCVRPTSETLFCEHYSKIIQSYRDLPKLYNQWCSVVRWEKTTRPFLRTREFLWQEGHTAHATADEAQDETLKMLEIYKNFCEQVLALPVISGEKTQSEKFAGAEKTYTIESVMHDGRALQSGTTHNFGDGFAKAFDITYTDKDNTLKHVHQTSWGLSTRLIGAIIMVHGDNSGLVLPPRVAPTQVIIIPIGKRDNEDVRNKASEIKDKLSALRVKLDDSDHSPGWKFSEYEMKGVPVRIEIGPKDLENGVVTVARRDTGEKTTLSLDGLADGRFEKSVSKLLEDIQSNLFEKAKKLRDEKTHSATDMTEFERILNENQGIIKAMWCGEEGCEDAIKDKTGASSRCISFGNEKLSDKCVCCGKDAKHLVYWGRSY